MQGCSDVNAFFHDAQSYIGKGQAALDRVLYSLENFFGLADALDFRADVFFKCPARIEFESALVIFFCEKPVVFVCFNDGKFIGEWNPCVCPYIAV